MSPGFAPIVYILKQHEIFTFNQETARNIKIQNSIGNNNNMHSRTAQNSKIEFH
jgi:hypothetical protein